MSTPLLEIKVRPDWQRLSQQMAAQRQRNWRVTEGALALAAMLALLLNLFWPGSPWAYLGRLLLFETRPGAPGVVGALESVSEGLQAPFLEGPQLLSPGPEDLTQFLAHTAVCPPSFLR